MSCRAMVICPASSGYEHRSATTLRVNSTLPAPMIATRTMSESVPCMGQVSKCDQSCRENRRGADADSPPPGLRLRAGSDGGDPYACVGEGSQDPRVRGLVGDELADGGDLADLGEGHQADLGAVGDDDDRAGALDQRAVRVGLDLVVGGEAGFEGDAVG